MIEVVKPQRERAGPPDRPEYFSGRVRLHHLVRPTDPGRVELIGVFFEPGARTIPHVHSTDQALYVLEGEGIVATEHERRIIRPGDVAVIPAHTWHWHGATRTSAMLHLSMRPAGPT
ncbi:MAG: cupin domain-containing protein, partial [Armatimonadota bacterium]|nr:cupin domain-containing protein [Armatimonadota bacterium]